MLCYDNDEAGKNATQKAIDLLNNSEFSVKVLQLPRRLEKQIQDHGFHVRLAGEQDVKRILAVYYQQDVVTEHFDQVDGERWVTDHG